MTKFHSTVSRRDFMKALGFGAAGLGAVAATAPVFHDLDELASSNGARVSHPCWVKERDFNDPTTPVDWDILDPNFSINSQDIFFGFKAPSDYPGSSMQYYNVAPMAGRNPKNVDNNVPGLRHKEFAFSYGAKLMERPSPWDSFEGPRLGTQESGMDPTPEWMGIPPWSGTPEEAASMVRAALHAYGANKVGFLEVSEKTKLALRFNTVRFEDCEEPYKEGSGRNLTYVLPNKVNRIMVLQITQPFELNKLQGDPKETGRPGELLHYGPMTCGSHMGYCSANLIQARCQAFLRVLGYFSPASLASYTNSGAGALSGLNEIGRTGFGISPEIGPMYRKNVDVFTDLPVALSKPMDAGIYKFCHDCGICAEICPWEAINKDKEPTWEQPPSILGYPENGVPAGTENTWSRPGLKRWPLDYLRCHGCPYCQNHCVFSQKNVAAVHSFVKATLATTSIFNGFFASMDKAFGYGHKDNFDEWWERDLDTYRYDLTYDTLLH